MHSPRVVAAKQERSELKRLHDYYLRKICDRSPATPRPTLFAELGMMPLHAWHLKTH